jgi:hypothetical protein
MEIAIVTKDEIQKVAFYAANATREVIHELCDCH